MTAQRQVFIWLSGFLFFVGTLYVLGDILLPFVLGMAVAYFLDPVIDFLEGRGMGRTLAVLLILCAFFVLAGGVLLLLFPLLQTQILNFVAKWPVYFSHIRGWAEPFLRSLETYLSAAEAADWRERLGAAAGDYAGNMVSWLAGFFSRIWGGGVALLNLLSLFVITPLVAFYLLRDWDIMLGRLDSWLPRRHASTIRQQAAIVDGTLSGFVRGMVLVCLSLSVFYGLLLSAIGLEFGLVIGILCGLVSFIPYVGAIGGFIVGVTIAFFQFPDLLPVGLVAATFFAGQLLEGHVLTPKLVGERIGLHPLWLVFALLAGGSLFGFLGLLLAVPLAAVIGVLCRFSLGQYLQSSLYLGVPSSRPAPSSRRRRDR